ncbi:MAG: cation transporter [Deltaproteobacteria bacterium]|nr:cation transporter [Deltaproteobacteria bacterium]
MSEYRGRRSTREGRSITLIGALINAILIFLKLLAGIYGMSQALIADAVHSISDLFTDAIVLLGLKIGRKEPDEGHPFGHARIETLASAIVGFALITTALYLGIRSVVNIYSHTEYHPRNLALIVAAVSVVSKEALYRYTVFIGRRIKSQLIVANAWHHRSDAISSLAALLGVAGARINPSWHILDSFAALLVSFFIVKVGLDILKNALREFTDTAPPPEILDKMRGCALSVDGVIDIHDLRVRTSGGLYQMEAHIVVDGQLTVIEGHKIAKAVENCLYSELDDFDRVIVHMDPAT